MMRSLITACGCSILFFFDSTCFIARTIAADPPIPEVDALVIERDTVLDPNKKYGRLVIQASNITIDGRGALIEGQTRGDATANGNTRQGVAIESKGTSGVVLRNVRCRGWETGLKLSGCDHWTVEGCDFSHNFHDPEFGWGENGRRGGIVCESVSRSTIRGNKANQVWDACVLVDSDDNVIVDNDFSHTSNTCMKLWHACRNTISGNNLSYGIRKKPDEVHARDSTGVLIESGSDGNRFLSNDCTHGGDGIFVRVLNRWCSVDNTFEGNDCSFANNNGFECWAPGNTFVRNKANHCSYGFWLGGSDRTLVEDNEASFNGLKEGNHNSPHLPQASHAGIVFMFGPSSHTILRGNRCEFNNGAGIACIGDIESRGAKWKAYHWIVEGNRLNNNRWGFYARFADWIYLNGNQLDANSDASIEAADGVTRLTTSKIGFEEFYQRAGSPSRLNVQIPESITAGQSFKVTLDGVKVAQPKIEWDFGDGTSSEKESAAHTYSRPGFYRLGVSAIGALQSQMGSHDVFVISQQPELGSNADEWSFQPEPGLKVAFKRDTRLHISGSDSIFADVRPYHGFLVQFVWHPKAGAVSLQSHTKLSFWLKAINPNLPGWQSENPEIRLTDSQGRKAVLKPKRDWLSGSSVNESRTGWLNIQVPLAGDSDWNRQGDPLRDIAELSIGLDSWDAGPLQVWLDGLTIEP